MEPIKKNVITPPQTKKLNPNLFQSKESLEVNKLNTVFLWTNFTPIINDKSTTTKGNKMTAKNEFEPISSAIIVLSIYFEGSLVDNDKEIIRGK